MSAAKPAEPVGFHLEWGLRGPKEPLIGWCPMPPRGMDNVLGLAVWPSSIASCYSVTSLCIA